MKTEKFLTLSKEEFEELTKGLPEKEIVNMLIQPKNDFMLWVKDYLEKNKPILHSAVLYSPYAYLNEVVDDVYGKVSITFFRSKDRGPYRYYATSDKLVSIFHKMASVPSTPQNTATGKFTVRYGEKRHYYIDVS